MWFLRAAIPYKRVRTYSFQSSYFQRRSVYSCIEPAPYAVLPHKTDAGVDDAHQEISLERYVETEQRKDAQICAEVDGESDEYIHPCFDKAA
jgi:hypothetical protein